jgi:hypothetical protein
MSFDHRPCQKLNSLKRYTTHAHDCMDAGGRATQDAKAEHYCIFQRCPRYSTEVLGLFNKRFINQMILNDA